MNRRRLSFVAVRRPPKDSPHARARDLYFSYDIGVNYWIRPLGPASGLTAYRVAPWRKWGWEHRVSVGFAWAMGASGDTIFANGYD